MYYICVYIYAYIYLKKSACQHLSKIIWTQIHKVKAARA